MNSLDLFVQNINIKSRRSKLLCVSTVWLSIRYLAKKVEISYTGTSEIKEIGEKEGKKRCILTTIQ